MSTLSHNDEAGGRWFSKSAARSKLQMHDMPVSGWDLKLACLWAISTSISMKTPYSGRSTVLARRKTLQSLLSHLAIGGGAEELLLLAPPLSPNTSGKRMATATSPEIKASFNCTLGNKSCNCFLMVCINDRWSKLLFLLNAPFCLQTPEVQHGDWYDRTLWSIIVWSMGLWSKEGICEAKLFGELLLLKPLALASSNTLSVSGSSVEQDMPQSLSRAGKWQIIFEFQFSQLFTVLYRYSLFIVCFVFNQ